MVLHKNTKKYGMLTLFHLKMKKDHDLPFAFKNCNIANWLWRPTPPPLTVSLTVKCSFFYESPKGRLESIQGQCTVLLFQIAVPEGFKEPCIYRYWTSNDLTPASKSNGLNSSIRSATMIPPSCDLISLEKRVDHCLNFSLFLISSSAQLFGSDPEIGKTKTLSRL